VRQDAQGFAFVVDTATAEYVTSRPPCDVYTTEPFLNTHAYALAVRRQTESLRHQVLDYDVIEGCGFTTSTTFTNVLGSSVHCLEIWNIYCKSMSIIIPVCRLMRRCAS
jgi:hypothetical protein